MKGARGPNGSVCIKDCRELRRALFAQGLRAHAARDPVFRLCGPLPPAVIFDHHASRHHPLGVGRRRSSWLICLLDSLA